MGAGGFSKFKCASEEFPGTAGSSPGLYCISAWWMDPELRRFILLDS